VIGNASTASVEVAQHLASKRGGEREAMRNARSWGTVTAFGENRTFEAETSRSVIGYAVMVSQITELPDRAGFLTVASRREWRRGDVQGLMQVMARGGRQIGAGRYFAPHPVGCSISRQKGAQIMRGEFFSGPGSRYFS
jgi:hypothetical protein